jgi:glycosyltransferase involved in cell wall biosynthesis
VKGYDVLLRALALLRADLPALRGVFIGDGPEAGRLQALVRSLGLGGRVRFAAPTADPGDFFASVDLFCAPSREEGFGLAILDAMRHGRPVVASRVGGIPDVVRDAETGVLVPAEDPAALAEAIRRVALDARLRARLGAAARKRASEDFSVGRMAESTRRVYEELAP